jgi:hypothetical protein
MQANMSWVLVVPLRQWVVSRSSAIPVAVEDQKDDPNL